MHLHFTELGAGAPLIVLHGLLGSHQNLLPACRAFAKHFQVFALDQRNHGHSPHHDVMHYEAMADDVTRFMDQHGLATACVLGHSMGGKTAMQLALHHAERVEKLVVVDMSPRVAGPRFARLLQALRELEPARLQSRQEADTRLAATVTDETVRQFLLKNLVPNDSGGYRWRIHLKGIAGNYDRLREAMESAIPFTGPTLFLRGGNSDYIGDDDVTEIHRLFPSAEIAAIPGAGHWVHVDAPGLFAEAALKFLSSN
jgi:pimeloyl-ACP methyl ester carboxylesterase